MAAPDGAAIEAGLSRAARERLTALSVFDSIASTNTYLVESVPPPPGGLALAVAGEQTAGRGQRGRRWVSPAGSGVYLSLAHTFATTPAGLPALTMAVGLGVVAALADFGADGVRLKWPNDLVALDGKLGGILTEAAQSGGGAVTVVTGIGINRNLPADLALDAGSEWSRQPVDLSRLLASPPAAETIVAAVTNRVLEAMDEFANHGFAAFAARWQAVDWLYGRQVLVDAAGSTVSGTAVGVNGDGALRVDAGAAGMQAIRSGTVLRAELPA